MVDFSRRIHNWKETQAKRLGVFIVQQSA